VLRLCTDQARCAVLVVSDEMASRRVAAAVKIIDRIVAQRDGRAMAVQVAWWWSRHDHAANTELTELLMSIDPEHDAPTSASDLHACLNRLFPYPAEEGNNARPHGRDAAVHPVDARMAYIEILGDWCVRTIERRRGSNTISPTAWLPGVVDQFTRQLAEQSDPAPEQIRQWHAQATHHHNALATARRDDVPELADPDVELWSLLASWELLLGRVVHLHSKLGDPAD
jgi:hypothetical protein